jgi:hypothetical protein
MGLSFCALVAILNKSHLRDFLVSVAVAKKSALWYSQKVAVVK